MSTFLPWYNSLGSFGFKGSNNSTWEVIWNAPRITASTAFYWLSWEGDFGNAFNVFTSYKRMSAPGTSLVWNLPFFSGDNIHSTTVYISGAGKGAKSAVQSYTVWALFNVASATFEGESEARENPEPTPLAATTLNTLPKKGVVVYHRTTGEIKHLHRVTAFSADQLPDDASLGKEALRLNQQWNREEFPAEILSINLDTLKEEATYRVDLTTKTLREIPENHAVQS